ncbi:MAG TPA: VWA domain-containing protein [Ilumatobacteraceae bacterium]|nr:VWA domain-containing protein [Ilumatobacteraceae bacterium]
MTDTVTTAPEAMAVAFARVLRGAGLAVPVSSVVSFAEALAVVGVDRRDDVYWSARATLVRRPEDHDLFDRAFQVFWEHAGPGTDAEPEPEPMMITLAVDSGDEQDGDEQDAAPPSDDPAIELRFSTTEILKHKDFAAYDDVELAEAHRLMTRMRVAGSPRRSLRMRPTSRRTPRPDLRRTVRAALRTEGEPITRHFREPATRHRRLVLLLDVSGSMEPYARALLRFVQATVAGRRRVEAFALGTRLTRVTRELASRDPDVALGKAAERVVDWSGGTRLGAGLHAFNEQWGVRGMARGAVVVILSDGWDRGDPQELADAMERLGRVAHRIVWVNPLKVTPGYAPLARGMAAALPFVDRFVEGHSLDAMERLADILEEP